MSIKKNERTRAMYIFRLNRQHNLSLSWSMRKTIPTCSLGVKTGRVLINF